MSFRQESSPIETPNPRRAKTDPTQLATVSFQSAKRFWAKLLKKLVTVQAVIL
jgi:hypothetical protein